MLTNESDLWAGTRYVPRMAFSRTGFAFAVFGVVVAGCGNNSTAAAKLSEGSPCVQSSDCAAGLGCGVDDYGKHACVSTCSGPNDLTGFAEIPAPYHTCWNGLWTPCGALPADQTCGCKCGSGEYCSVSADKTRAKCVAARAPGAPCDRSWQCRTGVCFRPPNGSGGGALDGGGNPSICSIPLGGPCTEANCEHCGADHLFCSAECSSDGDCPENWICQGTSIGLLCEKP